MFVLGCYRLISWNTFSDSTFQFCCCPSIGSISNPSWSKFMLLWQKALKICWTIHVYMYVFLTLSHHWDFGTNENHLHCVWRCPRSQHWGQVKIRCPSDLAKSRDFGLSENCLHFSEWKSWRPAASLGTWLCGLQIVEPLIWNPDRIPFLNIIMVILTVKEVVVIIIAMILIITLVIIIAMIRHTV